MKKIYLTIVVFCFLVAVKAQTTYTWKGGSGTSAAPLDYAVASNWNPTRTAPAANDILVFDLSKVDGNAPNNIYITNITTETIGQFQLIQSAGYATGRTLNFRGTPTTLTITGDIIFGGTNTKLNDGGYTLSIGGNLVYQGSTSYAIHASANYTPGSLSGKLLFTGNTPTFGASATGGNIGVGNVEISSNTNLTSNSAINAFTVNGNLQINTGGKVTLNGKTLQFTSGNPNSAGVTTPGVGGTISGGGVVVGNGSSSLNINQAGTALASGSQYIGTLNFDPTSATTSTLNNIAFTRSFGTLSIGTCYNNTLTIPGSITFSGTGTSAGTIDVGSDTLATSGSLVTTTPGVFIGAGLVKLLGNSKNLSGAGGLTLQNLAINYTAADNIIGATTINGTLTFSGTGCLINGSNYLTLSNGASIVRSGTGNIIGGGSAFTSIGTITGGSGYSTAPSVVVGTQWSTVASTAVSVNTQFANNYNLYTVTGAGTLSATAPTFVGGSAINGTATLTWAGIVASATATVASGAVTGVTITSGGCGYLTAPALTFTSASGTGASVAANISAISNGNPIYGATSTDKVNITINSTCTSGAELSGTLGSIGNLLVSSGTYTLLTPTSFPNPSSSNFISLGANTSTGTIGALRIGGISTPTLFPIGTNGNYLPVTITPAGTAEDYTISAFNGATVNALPNGTAFDATKKATIVDAVWTIKANTTPSGAVGVQFGWPAALEGSAFTGYANNQIGIANYTTDWSAFASATADNTANTASANQTSFGSFIVGNINTLLPVKFTSITATSVNGGNKISWQVATEVSVSKYVVEASSDGVHFTEKGVVAANGSNNYSYMDAQPLSGNNFYRVYSVDFSGITTYSNVVMLNNNNIATSSVSIYPNPIINRTLNIGLNNLPTAAYTIQMTDGLGKTIATKFVNHTGGSSNYAIDLPQGLASGNYYITIKDITKVIISKTVLVK
jgi:hypothetical protein